MSVTQETLNLLREFFTKNRISNCEQNRELLAQFFGEHELDIGDPDHLQLAFNSLKDQLVYEPVRPTAEQLKAENERQASVAYRFLSHHPELQQSPANAKVLQQYLIDRGLDFTIDGLEEALQECQGDLIFEQPKPYVAPAPTGLKYPWGDKLTPTTVAKMDRKDFRKYYNNPDFRQQLRDIGIRA